MIEIIPARRVIGLKFNTFYRGQKNILLQNILYYFYSNIKKYLLEGSLLNYLGISKNLIYIAFLY